MLGIMLATQGKETMSSNWPEGTGKVPYHLMTPAERTAQRIEQNKVIDEKAETVEYLLAVRREQRIQRAYLAHIEDMHRAICRAQPMTSCFGCGLDYRGRHAEADLAVFQESVGRVQNAG